MQDCIIWLMPPPPHWIWKEWRMVGWNRLGLGFERCYKGIISLLICHASAYLVCGQNASSRTVVSLCHQIFHWKLYRYMMLCKKHSGILQMEYNSPIRDMIHVIAPIREANVGPSDHAVDLSTRYIDLTFDLGILRSFILFMYLLEMMILKTYCLQSLA